MRDYLFDAVTGYFLVDMPTGWTWGWAELDPQRHTIIRTDALRLPNGEIIGQPLPDKLILPAGLTVAEGVPLSVRPLQLRLFKLAEALDYSGEANIYNDAALVMCPESEGIIPTRFVNVRTGATYDTEDEMWGSVRDGDGILMQGWGDDSSRPLWALRINDVAGKLADYKKVATVEEAVQWLS